MVLTNISQYDFSVAELRFLIPVFHCPRRQCFWFLIFEKLVPFTKVEEGWVGATEKNTHVQIQSCV